MFADSIDRTKNNVIGTMRHSMGCRLIQSDGREPCDCHPTDDSKAMTGADVLRIFKPLPPEEVAALRWGNEVWDAMQEGREPPLHPLDVQALEAEYGPMA